MGDLTVDVGATSFMCILYVVLGILSIMCNILNLSIWLSNRELRKKYIYLMALDAGELVNGISYVLVGTGRGMALLHGYLAKPLTVRQCFFEKYWPHSLILGTELPSFGIVLIACERLCAVLRPGMYNRIFMGKFKAALLLMVPLAGTVSSLLFSVTSIILEDYLKAAIIARLQLFCCRRAIIDVLKFERKSNCPISVVLSFAAIAVEV
ncbi:hypothetical protein ANCCAN_02925 [Ancylostoma caninum]|uniref:G-protein coupled receptors family 1 profile domain-containing protein n=1 Tax=Ancylostoma caninum TaxID=29170 RepID=A0A368H2T7_ANCCA|nr:hypothetical protein ANCCAN_02925 [Ancylostoma caninum]